jgi:segregation and condensation protein B
MKTRPKDVIESLIFVSLEPLNLEKIKSICKEFTDSEIEQAIQELIESYASNDRGIQIIQAAGGYLFSTKSEHDQWIRRLLSLEQKSKLSHAALETLATVAYHQPITLAEISALRGVDASHSLKSLLQKKLVKITGRKKSPGRPLIYRTTDKFLTYFGLDNIKDLPSEEEIIKILDEENILDE